MKIYFPDNIFTRILLNSLSEDKSKKISFKASSLLSQSVKQDEDSIALIPTLDIINHPYLHISSSVGISFDASLCNSFIYYKPGKEEIEKINLAGDISSMDVLLLKIFFKELYNSEPEIKLQTKLTNMLAANQFISGDENFKEGRFEKGISFSEEMVELISAPYVNYVLASKNKKLIEDYSALLLNAIDSIEYSKESHYDFDTVCTEFIKNNMVSVIYNFSEQDIIGIKELLQLPYFHGYIKEIVDLKLI